MGAAQEAGPYKAVGRKDAGAGVRLHSPPENSSELSSGRVCHQRAAVHWLRGDEANTRQDSGPVLGKALLLLETQRPACHRHL